MPRPWTAKDTQAECDRIIACPTFKLLMDAYYGHLPDALFINAVAGAIQMRVRMAVISRDPDAPPPARWADEEHA